ncbi:MAG: phosphoribosylglycinamide formyltransferase [Elusimicrobiota bacterium]
MVNIGVLVSGGGTNLQAIIDAVESGKITNGRIVVVISNRSDAYALERASKHGIPAVFLERKKFGDNNEYHSAVKTELVNHDVGLVILAGYLLKLSSGFVKHFHGKILNIHPALLPKFGGKGMYGHYVHEAVLASGVKESGCTVHVVDSEYDHGKIVLQSKVPVLPGDTPETLAKRVLVEEHKILPEAVRMFTDGILCKLTSKIDPS